MRPGNLDMALVTEGAKCPLLLFWGLCVIIIHDYGIFYGFLYLEQKETQQFHNERQAIKDEDIFHDGCGKSQRVKSGLRFYV